MTKIKHPASRAERRRAAQRKKSPEEKTNPRTNGRGIQDEAYLKYVVKKYEDLRLRREELGSYD